MIRPSSDPDFCSLHDKITSDLQSCTLTPRETEVMVLIDQGLTNKQAARLLGISYRTVELHRIRARRKRMGLL